MSSADPNKRTIGIDQDGFILRCCDCGPDPNPDEPLDEIELWACHNILFCETGQPAPFTRLLYNGSYNGGGKWDLPRNQCIWREPHPTVFGDPCNYNGPYGEGGFREHYVGIGVEEVVTEDESSITYKVKLTVQCNAASSGGFETLVDITFSKTTPECKLLTATFNNIPELPGVVGEVVINLGNTPFACDSCQSACGAEDAIAFSKREYMWQDYAIAGSVVMKGWQSSTILPQVIIPADDLDRNQVTYSYTQAPFWSRNPNSFGATQYIREHSFLCSQANNSSQDDPDGATACLSGGYQYSCRTVTNGTTHGNIWWPYTGVNYLITDNKNPNTSNANRELVPQARTTNDLYIQSQDSVITKPGAGEVRNISTETINYECGYDIWNLEVRDGCPPASPKFKFIYDGGLRWEGFLAVSGWDMGGHSATGYGTIDGPGMMIDPGQPPFPGMICKSLPLNALQTQPGFDDPIPLNASIHFYWNPTFWDRPFFLHSGFMAEGIENHPDNPNNVRDCVWGKELLPTFNVPPDEGFVGCPTPGTYNLKTYIPEIVYYWDGNGNNGGSDRNVHALNIQLIIEPFG